MCKFLSLIVHRNGRIYGLPGNDSHSDIQAHYRLRDDREGARRNWLRIEITSPTAYRVDEADDDWPSWYDDARAAIEAACARVYGAVAPARATYYAAVAPARAAYVAVEGSARATYHAAAYDAAYVAVEGSARATYDAAVDSARATYDAVEGSASAAYHAAVDSASAAYHAAVAPVFASARWGA